ncbi:MAG TPA: sugar transferase [Methylomirabilota bacterium]|nr:sugar transferase [Methylomirabilota bacterium]
MKRLFDILASISALIVLAPLLLVISLLIKVTSPGPIFYRAARSGRNGKTFTMLKFRSMRVRPSTGSVITGANDSRIFPVGKFVRVTKIDELPQLINVLKGEMSIVGPRPEDPKIVEHHYTPLLRKSLEAAPGLASPGSIFNYTHGDACLAGDDPERLYIEKLMPIKVAMDVYYVQNQSLAYDLQIIARTVKTILQIAAGRKDFPHPPEHEPAQALLRDDQHAR